MPTRMHYDEIEISEELARSLIDIQFVERSVHKLTELGVAVTLGSP